MNNNDVVKKETTAPVEAAESALSRARQRIEMLEVLQREIQRTIRPQTDVRRIEGKLRRTVNFARRAYRVVGGHIEVWHDPQTGLPYRREQLEDSKGVYYAFTVGYTWHMPSGERVEQFARITSREPFFGVDDGELRDPSEINEADILEMAKTEAFKSVIFTGLGFSKDVSEDELRGLDIDLSKVTGYKFSRGTHAATAQDTPSITELRRKVREVAARLVSTNWKHKGAVVSTPEEVLRVITENPARGFSGYTSFDAIKAEHLEKVLAKLTEVYDNWTLPPDDEKEDRKDSSDAK